MLDGFFLLRVQPLEELRRAREPVVVRVPGRVVPVAAVVPARPGPEFRAESRAVIPLPAGVLVRAAVFEAAWKGPSA